MMLNKGQHGRQQILSRATVELMTSDQLTPEQRAGSEIFFGPYSSWGLGMAVDIQRNEIFRTPGRFGWDGGFGTSGIHRSCRENDRHPLHAAHDGFAGIAEGVHRLLDTGVRSNGIGNRKRPEKEADRFSVWWPIARNP